MTELVAKVPVVDVVVPVVLVVVRVVAVRDDSEGSTPLCLPHNLRLSLLAPVLGGRSPCWALDHVRPEKHHVPPEGMEAGMPSGQAALEEPSRCRLYAGCVPWSPVSIAF